MFLLPIGRIIDPSSNAPGGCLRMRPIDDKDKRGTRGLSRSDRQILLVWLFFVVILASSALLGSLADGLRPQRSAKAPQQQSAPDSKTYTGSILFVSAGGDSCWQRFWDNQTGRYWDSGLVSCQEVAPHSMIAGHYSSIGRTEAIRRGFLGRANHGW
jgi:hypothetical protein